MNRLPIADTNFQKDSTICESQVCEKAHDCANHETAGDYRSGLGETPVLSYKDGEVVCEGDTYGNIRGLLYQRDGVWKVYNEMDGPDVVLGEIEQRSSVSPAIPTFASMSSNKKGK